MKPTRQSVKRRHNPIESSDEDAPQRKKSPENKNLELSEDSSSDSDIESYLKAPSKLDFNSSFFNPIKTVEVDEKTENRADLLGRLSDSESSNEEGDKVDQCVTRNYERNDDEIPSFSGVNNFEHINAYNTKFEETKRFIEMYKARKEQEEPATMDVDNILEREERAFYNSLGSSGFETLSDDENKSDWEEVQQKEDKSLIRKEGVEITINVPGNIKKKKSLDLMAAIKRRINRVKKENQVFVHKAHLLCWIAHGFYVNAALNNQTVLGMALSLLPSKQCYPSSRIDLSYLENIVQWYKKTITNKNLTSELNGPLDKLLEEQIVKKEAYNYKMYIYVFICILRSLGAKCRLILSLQIEPIRPSQNELCSLSNKNKTEPETVTPKTKNLSKTETAKKKTKTVTFKINSSLTKSASKKQKPSNLNTNMVSAGKSQHFSEDKAKHQTDNLEDTKSKQKISLRDKLKKPNLRSKSRVSLKQEEINLKKGDDDVSDIPRDRFKPTTSKVVKEVNSKRNKELVASKGTKVKEVKSAKDDPTLKQPSTLDKTVNKKTNEKSVKNISKTKNDNNTEQKSIKSSSKEERDKRSLINIQNNVEKDTIKEVTNTRRSTRRSSRSPILLQATTKENESTRGGVSKENEQLTTKPIRQKKSPANKQEIAQNSKSENITSKRNKPRRYSKSPMNEDYNNDKKKVEEIREKDSNVTKNDTTRNTKNIPDENVVEERIDKTKDQSSTLVEVEEKNYSNIKTRLRKKSKSPTVEDPKQNKPGEEEQKFRYRRQSNSAANSKEGKGREILKTEDTVSIKSKNRRNSKSPSGTTCGEEEINEKERSESITNPDDIDEKVRNRTRKVGLKIKMPLKKGTNPVNSVSVKESEEEDEVIDPQRRVFVLPTIKQELLTPKKRSHDSDDDFLGFSAEETKVLMIPQVDGGTDTPPIKKRKSKPNLSKLKMSPTEKCPRNHPTRLKKVSGYAEVDSEDDFAPRSSSISKAIPFKKIHSKFSTSSQDSERSRFFGGSSSSGSRQLDVRNDIMDLVKGSVAQQRETYRRKLAKNKRNLHKTSSEDDSDYLPDKIPHRKSDSDDVFKEKSATKVKRRIPMKKDLIEIERKRMQAKEEIKKTKGINVWVEIFAEAEEKWISVDVIKGQVHCVKEIYARATHPVSYILGFDNDNYIKDITKRYCENWNTVTRKLRVDDKWWEQTLAPYRAPRNPREKEEDEDLARQQLDQPLPRTISEYKNHPLYVLKRHLLKFESIYPPDALTLGFVRNEPVYSRDCVHVLHSRDIWLKHAKVVKLGETPYKIVKARPKYDKLSNTVITDQMLEIFGKWQVEDYVPPTAENGIVPKNAYGNVDLFKSCMLPKETVHLQFPGLNKVARKLNIDCPPAVTGFDFHSGYSHPIFDGFVVCKEFSEILVAAWVQEQEELERREQEKNEKRIYDNWKKLIKGLLIRERLKRRYDFGAPSSSKDNKSESAEKLPKKKHN